MYEYTIVSGNSNKTGIFTLKEQGSMVYQKIGLVFSFLRGVFK
jgi:hypothetical protein